MGGLNISVTWRSAVTQKNGEAWRFPEKFTPYFKDRYSIPAIYRWRVDKRQPGEQERIYIGEGEELTRRILWVLKPHSSSKPGDTNRRLNEMFRQCVLRFAFLGARCSKITLLGFSHLARRQSSEEKRSVWIDVADIDPFEINGIRFEQRDLGDLFKRRMLEYLLLAIAEADKSYDLLNKIIEPVDRDRELLIRRLSPRQVRETKERYLGAPGT